MCHRYVDLKYLKREENEGMKESVRNTTPAPAPPAEPGGLVAVLRGLVERVRPAKATAVVVE